MGGIDVGVAGTVGNGRYRLSALLEARAGVEVFAATDQTTGGDVIVKVLGTTSLPVAARLRLKRDTLVLEQLHHPWLAPLLDSWWDAGRLYLVEPVVPGVTLQERLRRGPLSVQEALMIGRCLAAGLVQAHGRGIVHGDVQPANIVVDENTSLTQATLTNFSSTYSTSQVTPINGRESVAACYLSPERAGLLAYPVDARSDLYSLGVVLFECLSGYPPFKGSVLGDVLRQHLCASPPPLPRLGTAMLPVVDEIVRRLLSKEPDNRYQSASALLADLEAVVVAVAEGHADSSVIVGAHERRLTLAEPALIGRGAELAALLARLDRASRGGGQLILLEAESGGGKTRLLDEIERRAASQGCWVLRGQASDYAAFRPLQVFDGVANGICETTAVETRLSARIASAIGQHREALADVFPALGPMLGGTDAVAGPSEYGEVRSAAAVAALLDALGSPRRPAVVLLDDCQWADELTVRTLACWRQTLEGRRPGRRHVVVVASFRSDEVAADHPLRQLTDDRLSLPPLDDEDIRDLAASMGGPLPASALEVVVSLARGNPFMASAVLRGLTETGALFPTESGWHFEAAPATLQSSREAAAVLVRRLELLDPDTLGLVSAGAVLGRQFDLKAAARLAGMRLETAVAAVEEAKHRHLLWRSQPPCTFVHDQVREAVLLRLPAPERAKLHRQVAADLIEQDPVPSFDVAYHLDAAGMAAEAVPYALAAAEAARARHSLQVAEAQYRIAERGLAVCDERRGAVAEGIGQVLMLRGRYDEAERWLTLARSLAPNEVTAARLEGELGELAFRRGVADQASEHLDRALRLLGQRVPRRRLAILGLLAFELLVLLTRPLGRCMPHRQRPAASGEATRAKLIVSLHARLVYVCWCRRSTLVASWAQLRALHLAERYQFSRERAYVYSIHGASLTAALPVLARRGRSFATRAIALHEELEDSWGRGQARHFLAVVLHASSRFTEAAATCEEAARLLERAGDRWELNSALWHRALCLYRLGDLREAADAARAVHRAAVEIGDNQAAAISLEIWAKATGGKVSAEPIQAALEQSRSDLQATVSLLQADGIRLLHEDRVNEAVAVLARAERLIRRFRFANVYVATVRPWMATAERRAVEQVPPWAPDQRATALRRARRTAQRACRTSRFYRNDRPHALREAALVAAMGGHPRRARRLLGQSSAAATRLGEAAEAAETRRVWGELGTALGWAADESRTDRQTLTTLQPKFEADHTAAPALTLGLADRLDALLEAGRRIASTGSPETLNQAVQDAVATLLRPEWCEIARVGSDGHPDVADTWHPNWAAAKSLIQQAVATGRPAFLDQQGRAEPSSLSLVMAGIRSAACIPLVVHGQAVACVLATHRHLEGLFGEPEGRLADFVSALAGAVGERESLQRHLRAEIIVAQEEERSRVARDLHDEVGQSITSVLLTLRLLETSLQVKPTDLSEPLERAREVRDIANETLGQVRRLVFELRPPALDDLGLAAAVRRLIDEISSRHGVAVDLIISGIGDGQPRFPPEVETATYRVVQEALTNIVRHSQASAGCVILARDIDRLRVVVEDEGVGFDPDATGMMSFGLRGMRERTELVGGTLSVTSAPGEGTTVVLEVPSG